MDEKEPEKISSIGKEVGTISIQVHPDEVIKVDPTIVASMNARLAWRDHLEVFDRTDRTDRTIDELAIQREKEKLKRVFSSLDQIRESFSSVKKINAIRQELKMEHVDRDLLKEYSFAKFGEKNVDEVDFYGWFVFGAEKVTKELRLDRTLGIQAEYLVLKPVIDDYRQGHFDVLTIGREVIQLNPDLRLLFIEKKLTALFDGFLSKYYG